MASLAATYHQSTISSIPICNSGSNSSSSSWRNKCSLKLDAPLRTSPIPLLFSSSSLKFLDNATKTQVDVDALATALEQCAATHDFQLGTQIHARIIYTGLAPDVYLSSKLLYFYSCIGDVNAARLVFDATPCVHLNLFFWNTMIRAYVNSDRYGDAIELFCEMEAMGRCPNEFTFPFVLKSCSVLGCVELGRQIHCLMVVSGYQHDVFAASALLDLYGKWGFLGDACELFNRIPQRSLVTLNSMLSGYAQNGCWLQALDVLELVEQSGDGIDVSSWNSIMAGCVRHGDGDLALETLRRMMASGPSVKPDSATFNTLLPVISSDASLVQLKELHGYTLKQQGLDSNCSLIQNSGSEEDLNLIMDQRKRKRMLSNRESARRSRMRKQKHLDDLMAQVAQLRKENNQILMSMNITTQHSSNIEAENSVLRAQMGELSHRLESLNEILNYINATNSVFETEDPYISDDSFMNPWNLLYMNQPIMASADMFGY